MVATATNDITDQHTERLLLLATTASGVTTIFESIYKFPPDRGDPFEFCRHAKN